MKKGNQNAKKPLELLKTEVIVLPCTKAEKEWVKKQAGRRAMAQFIRNQIFPCMICCAMGAAFGVGLALVV